jgi:hypothetical protein
MCESRWRIFHEPANNYSQHLVPKPENYSDLEAVVQSIYCESEYGVISSLCTLEGGYSLRGNEGIRHASQNATRSSRHYASLRHDDRPPQAAK